MPRTISSGAIFRLTIGALGSVIARAMVVAACLPICWAGMRTFGKALIGRTTVGHGLDLEAMRNVAPGLIVALIHIFWAAMALGFYTASTITFFIPVSRYNLAPNNDP